MSATTPPSDNSQSRQGQLADTCGLGGLDQKGTATNSTQGEEKKRKRNTGKSVVVDHSYSDYSTYQLSVSERRNARTFPMKLHAIISNSEYQHIICWMPHGRSWRIIDKEKLASVVCFKNFNHDSFGSFTRSVNGWGFKRMVGPGPDRRSYYHECFLRGLPDVAQLIVRVTTPGKRLPNPDEEPDFCDISKRFPLPDSVKVVTAPPSMNCRDTKRQCQAQQLSTTSDETSHASSTSTELVRHGYPYGHLQIQMYPNRHGRGNLRYPRVPPPPLYPNVRRVSKPPCNQQHGNHSNDSSRSGYDNLDDQGKDAAAKARHGEYEHDFNCSDRGPDFQLHPIQTNHHDQSLTPVTAWGSEFSYLYDESLFSSGATSIRSTPCELGNDALAEDVTDDFKSESSNHGGWLPLSEMTIPPANELFELDFVLKRA